MSCNKIDLRAILQEIPQPLMIKINLEIIYLTFNSTLPWANELMCNIANDTHGYISTMKSISIDK